MMRLADFISLHQEAILLEWEKFAVTRLPAASAMESSALRDHGPQILDAIVKDLGTPQTREAQARKSKGLARVALDAPETAAQTHAVLRAKAGFDINQLASEYRALRASVLRLWFDEAGAAEATALDDVVRFNEAIDQALAESISFFHDQVEHDRHLLLGVVSHDLRSPLQTIHVTASYLAALRLGEPVSSAAARLIKSGARMQALLDDIVEFNRVKLGLGLRVLPTPCDLRQAFVEEIDLLSVASEGRELKLTVAGHCEGVWDGNRLRQMLANLVQNAMQHGSPTHPVRVEVLGEKERVVVRVQNDGPVIPPDELKTLFTPLRNGKASQRSNARDRHLGLGLFVVKEIVAAHGGEVHAESDARRTVFTVTLPR